eukprot:8618643-Ditylum_brightwellii.AAC.1
MGKSEQAITVSKRRTSGQSDDSSILGLQTSTRLKLQGIYNNVWNNCKVWGQKVTEEKNVALNSTIKELIYVNLQLVKSLVGVKK